MQVSGGFQLWVGNAPFDATEEELKNVLSVGSKVLNVRVKYDSESGQSKGFAFVEFPDAESCLLLLQYHQQQPLELRGRRLKVDWATAELREAYGHRVASSGGNVALSTNQHQTTSASAESGTKTVANSNLRSQGPRRGERVSFSKMEGALHAGALSLTAVAAPDPFAATPAALPVVISEVMQCMSTAHLLLLLQEFQLLSQQQPQLSRCLLSNHPSLAYALVYAMFLTGATSSAQLKAEKTTRRARLSAHPVGVAVPQVSFDALTRLPPPERRQLKRNRDERLRQLEEAAQLPTRKTAPSNSPASEAGLLSGRGLDSASPVTPRQATSSTTSSPTTTISNNTCNTSGAASSSSSSSSSASPPNKASSTSSLLKSSKTANARTLSPSNLNSSGHRSGSSSSKGVVVSLSSSAASSAGSSATSASSGGSSVLGGGGALPSASTSPPSTLLAPQQLAQQNVKGKVTVSSSSGVSSLSGKANIKTGSETGSAQTPGKQLVKVTKSAKTSKIVKGVSPKPSASASLTATPSLSSSSSSSSHNAVASGTSSGSREKVSGQEGASSRDRSASSGGGGTTGTAVASVSPSSKNAKATAASAGGRKQPDHPAWSVQPAPAALVDEVVKSPAMLANVLSASPASMAKWTESQRRQVMALQSALLRRGFDVAS